MPIYTKFVKLQNEEIDRIILNKMMREFSTTEGAVASVFKKIYTGRFIYKLPSVEEQDHPFGAFHANSKCWFEYDNEKGQYIRCSDTLLFDLFYGEFRNYYINISKRFETEPILGQLSRIICLKFASPLFHEQLIDILKLLFEPNLFHSDKN